MDEDEATIRCRGYRYRYRLVPGPAGGGTPVLILGGAFQSMAALRGFADFFRRRTDVILVDLPGSGYSDRLPPELGGPFLAECLQRVLDRLGVTRVDAIGVSFGTAAVYELARSHPASVRRMVLIGTMSHVDAHMQRAMEVCIEALDRGDMRRFASLVSQTLMNHARAADISGFEPIEKRLRAGLRRLPTAAADRFRENSARLMHHRRLGVRRSRVPALIFTGEHDPLTTPRRCREVAGILGDALFTTVRNADHLVPLERPEVCCELVEAFLCDTPLIGDGWTTVERTGAGLYSPPCPRPPHRRPAPAAARSTWSPATASFCGDCRRPSSGVRSARATAAVDPAANTAAAAGS